MIHFLSMDPCTATSFKGLAMQDSNSLSTPNADPALYILNTGSKTSRGEHWCVVYFSGNTREFFDPFGMPPALYGFEQLLSTKKPIPRVKRYNRVCLQSVNSIVCGHHCIFYAFHKCRGFSMNEILSLYPQNDVKKNDKVALQFVLQFGISYYPRM